MGRTSVKLRVVLDTNALVSCLLFGGVPGRIVSLGEEGRLLPLVSKDVFLEYIRVLGYRKFGLDQEEIKGLIEEHILPFAETVRVEEVPEVVVEDCGDDKFLALAVAGKARFIISGDRHLLELGRYRGVEIMGPRRFLERPELQERQG